MLMLWAHLSASIECLTDCKGAVPIQKDLNFFAAYQSPGANEWRNKAIFSAGVTALIVCAGAIGATFGVFHLDEAIVSQRIAADQAYMEQSNVKSAISTMANAQTKIAGYGQYATMASNEIAIFHKCPQISSALFQQVTGALPGNVSVQSMSYDTGTITVACTSSDPLGAARFAQNLNSVSTFSDITCGNVTSVNGAYSCSVTLTVKGG